ncbi:cytochrome C [Rhodobacterales bacterium 52_120_T64]|nr:cytochrome C [Rhodobacterales bacterium 52_120_T64]
MPVHAQADVEEGAKLFRRCFSCHMLGVNAFNRTGPHLNDLFGRAAGSVEGFQYSDDMNRAAAGGLIWDVDNLDAFIENPKNLISRTKMRFNGIANPKDRANLMAYLRQFSDNPSNIPEADPTLQARDPDIDPDILAIKGDPEYGAYLSGECVTCHQTGGGDDGIPSIVGWTQLDFVTALQAYKSEHRNHPLMQLMAKRLSNEEIAALAAYFETVER